MNLNLNVKMPKLHNVFEIAVTDTKTGKVVQTAKAENVVFDNFYHALASQWSTWGGRASSSHQIGYGDGTGTPSTSGTSLFNPLGYKGIDNFELTVVDDDLATLTGSITFGDSEFIGGEITELCFGFAHSYHSVTWRTERIPITHAMLQDVNGNPISIGPKTDTQIITIYFTLFLERTAGMDPFPNTLSAMFFANINYNYLVSSISLWPNDLALSIGGTYDQPTKKYTSAVTRLGSTVGNGAGMQDVRIMNIASFEPIILPDESVFPTFTFTPRTIATGDGVTRHFNLQSGFFVPGTISLKVDGVAQVEGIDYIARQGADQIITGPYPYTDVHSSMVYADVYESDDTKTKGDLVSTCAKYGEVSATMTRGVGFMLDFRQEICLTSFTLMCTSYWYTSTSTFPFSISLSTDGITWTDLADAVFQHNTRQYVFSLLGQDKFRYVWLKPSPSHGSAITFTSFQAIGPPSIEFITAPAVDAVISAGWDTDLPPKNANILYDAQWSMQSSW